MPVNKERCRRLKDTWAAPGSALLAALEEGDKKKAEAIYNDCERTLARLEGRQSYFELAGTVRLSDQKVA